MRSTTRPSSAGGQAMAFYKPTETELESRYSYHPPVRDQAERYNSIRKECLALAKHIVTNTPCSPEQARALNALDEVMMLANAAIARNEPTATLPAYLQDKK